MKLKPIQSSVEVIELGKRRTSNDVPIADKLKVLPQFPRCDNAFYSYNRELKAKKGIVNMFSKAIHNPDFCGNGARGRMTHTKENLEKVAGNTNIRRIPKVVKEINIDSVAVEEQKQLNFDGAALKGKQITSAEEAKAFIRKFGGSIKRNRGDHFRSGRYSGGLLRREYERETQRLPSTGDNVEVESEFSNLQQQIQDQQTDSNIKVGDEGM